jgi:hypothetical protein
MWSEYFRHFAKSPLLVLPVVSLAIFGSLFVGVLVWIAWRGRALEDDGLLPLERDSHE